MGLMEGGGCIDLNGFCESDAWVECRHCLAYMYITPLSWSRATRLRILFPL